MRAERNNLFSVSRDFFELDGSAVMKLTAGAAIAVCAEAAAHDLVVVRVEGGIWHHPGFEARLDCIWDGADPPLGRSVAENNNARAASFVVRVQDGHGAFILTTAPISGYRHKGL